MAFSSPADLSMSLLRAGRDPLDSDLYLAQSRDVMAQQLAATGQLATASMNRAIDKAADPVAPEGASASGIHGLEIAPTPALQPHWQSNLAASGDRAAPGLDTPPADSGARSSLAGGGAAQGGTAGVNTQPAAGGQRIASDGQNGEGRNGEGQNGTDTGANRTNGDYNETQTTQTSSESSTSTATNGKDGQDASATASPGRDGKDGTDGTDATGQGNAPHSHDGHGNTVIQQYYSHTDRHDSTTTVYQTTTTTNTTNQTINQDDHSHHFLSGNSVLSGNAIGVDLSSLAPATGTAGHGGDTLIDLVQSFAGSSSEVLGTATGSLLQTAIGDIGGLSAGLAPAAPDVTVLTHLLTELGGAAGALVLSVGETSLLDRLESIVIGGPAGLDAILNGGAPTDIDLHLPQVHLPEIHLPEVHLPEIHLPLANLPGSGEVTQTLDTVLHNGPTPIDLLPPDIQLPDIHLPDIYGSDVAHVVNGILHGDVLTQVGLPNVGLPDVELPDIGLSDIGFPNGLPEAPALLEGLPSLPLGALPGPILPHGPLVSVEAATGHDAPAGSLLNVSALSSGDTTGASPLIDAGVLNGGQDTHGQLADLGVLNATPAAESGALLHVDAAPQPAAIVEDGHPAASALDLGLHSPGGTTLLETTVAAPATDSQEASLLHVETLIAPQITLTPETLSGHVASGMDAGNHLLQGTASESNDAAAHLFASGGVIDAATHAPTMELGSILQDVAQTSQAVLSGADAHGDALAAGHAATEDLSHLSNAAGHAGDAVANALGGSALGGSALGGSALGHAHWG